MMSLFDKDYNFAKSNTKYLEFMPKIFDAIRTISFSPTGTTKTIINSIVEGINLPVKEQIDLTKDQPDNRMIEDQLLTIIGIPVYAGRMPLIAIERLRRLKAKNVPTVIVVVYGNRAFEDALIECSDEVKQLGFEPKFAGAFIGEHSWNTSVTKIAEGRPDKKDLQSAIDFGKSIASHLNNKDLLDNNYVLNIPGNPVYKERKVFPIMKPKVNSHLCNTCGQCEQACPASAIIVNSEVIIDENKCTLCSACIKQCPQKAMEFNDPWLDNVTNWLSQNFKERKEPEFFF